MSTRISEASYQEELNAWRKALDDRLRAEDSWLALAGLYWLEEGGNPFGSRGDAAIPLVHADLMPIAGEFVKSGDQIELNVRPGNRVEIEGEQQEQIVLRPDVAGNPQRIVVGRYTMMLIERGGRLGIRLWDNERSERRDFAGRIWFPIDPAYRLQAKFIAYDPGKTIAIPNELGMVDEEVSPGFVEFTVDDQGLRLDALEGANAGLFFLLKDETAGGLTYGSGRFLLTSMPTEETVELDFNRAYNPPCAFTPFATCPLAPMQNHLPVAINAGERVPEMQGK